ncbi:MAG: hypothetical protein KDK41_12375 [Leptospiraceae bacterium]|nr:hypothetical protein [Leptospiraceae bacterium]
MLISGNNRIVGYLGQNKVLVARSSAPEQLTPGEEDLRNRLKNRDQEVKAHELAHLTMAKDLAVSGPKYNYQIGPDGKAYAVGGEVTLALKPSHDAASTIEDARRLRAAALAVKNPSVADLAAAGVADQIEQEARASNKNNSIDFYA